LTRCGELVEKLAAILYIPLKLNAFAKRRKAALGDLGLGMIARSVEESGSRLLTAFHPPIEIETNHEMI
jgi:hypothetical protein